MNTKSLDRTPSLGDQPSPGKPFKRGHIRRSSYESAQIQLNFARRTTTARGTAALAEPNKCFGDDDEEEVCCSSSTDKPDCSYSTTSDAVDSGLGEGAESESKRSSLDRRSDFSDWEDQVKEEPAKGGATRFFTFPKSLFSRNKSQWRMFGSSKTKDLGVVHTTGLILEERPNGLPAKSPEEATRHKQMHHDIIEQMKKKEQRIEKERRAQRAEQKRLEEQAAAACRLWTLQILPKWDEMKDSKRCRELWWQGIPAKVRGRVWALVIGNDLNITTDLYEMVRVKAENRLQAGEISLEKEWPGNREYTVGQIHLDVSRTFPSLGIFQNDAPYYGHLLRLLSMYACYRPDVGYVQSMPFLAAVLLLQMEPYPAFVAFANIMSRPLQAAFFCLRQPQMTEYFIAYDQYLEQELPNLHKHLDLLDVRPDLYLIEWIYAMFAKSLPLDVTCRVWDVYLRDGEEFIFKTALGILRMYEGNLLEMEFDECLELLTRLPESLSGSELFRNIDPFMRPYASGENKTKKRFLQILQEVDERVNPGGMVAQSQISTNVQGLKMSKSLSGFIGDLLGGPSPS